MIAMNNDLKTFLNEKYLQYNHTSFIADDPISIPHRFTKKQDIEIAAFFSAVLAWGTRKGIIHSCNRILQAMHPDPYTFIVETNLNKKQSFQLFEGFVHRTFNHFDLWHLFHFLQFHYRQNESLETAFSKWLLPDDDSVEKALIGFHNYVFGFSEEAKEELHCRKHISTPLKKSACKRLNMFLRWMVRRDKNSVDFGLWQHIKPSQLICPLDVHVSRVARRLKLLERKQDDWMAAVELTACLKTLDMHDPVKYDYALFGLGVVEKY